jgi:hypothetical protein
METKVIREVQPKTDFQMAWAWLEDNGYSVRVDEGNGFLEVEVFNIERTDMIYVGISKHDIELLAHLWRESNN